MSKQPARIPTRFQAKPIVDDPQVSTGLSVSRTYDPAQINALQNLGMVKLDGDRFRSLGELGKAVNSIGLVDILNGGVLISADNLTQAIAFCGRVVSGEPDEDGKVPTRQDRLKASRELGYLSGQLARVSGNATKGVREVAEVAIQVDKQRRQSFQPGMTITVQDKAPTNP
jgi:hypothetical protein